MRLELNLKGTGPELVLVERLQREVSGAGVFEVADAVRAAGSGAGVGRSLRAMTHIRGSHPVTVTGNHRVSSAPRAPSRALPSASRAFFHACCGNTAGWLAKTRLHPEVDATTARFERVQVCELRRTDDCVLPGAGAGELNRPGTHRGAAKDPMGRRHRGYWFWG